MVNDSFMIPRAVTIIFLEYADPSIAIEDNDHEDAQPMLTESSVDVKTTSNSGAAVESDEDQEIRSPRNLKDAIKPKHKRKKKKGDRS
jgi:exosome complex component RRP45